MISRLKRLCIVLSLVIGLVQLQAQGKLNSKSPEVGKPCPAFTLDDIYYFKQKKAGLESFRGKWLFLDFWNSYCTNCFESFPETDKFREEFKDKMQFLLIGANDSDNKHIKAVYEKFRQKFDLHLSVAFDSVLLKRWDIYAYPRIIIIDPKGVVRVITSSRGLTKDKLRALMKGEAVVFSSNDRSKLFNPGKLTLSEMDTTKDPPVLYQSVLSTYRDEQISSPTTISQDYDLYKKPIFQATGIPLAWLFNYAYFGYGQWGYFADSLYGKASIKPVLMTRDSALFKADFINLKNLYNYNLCIPAEKASREKLMSVLKQELSIYWGFDVSMETRMMPCWELVYVDSANPKLTTKGGDYFMSDLEAIGFTGRNMPVHSLLRNIAVSSLTGLPFFDETGIHYNIDVDFDVIMSDLDDVNKKLSEYGLGLVKGQKEMKVLVIKDSVNQ